jgi:hypothetical protein
LRVALLLPVSGHRAIRRSDETSPSAKLADAQHEVAANYGFASWAALKAHVELLAENLHFERYTPAAKRVLYFSRAEAAKRGSPAIEPEHVVLALARDGHVAMKLALAQLPLGAIRRSLLPTTVMIPFSRATLRLLKRVAAAGKGEINVAHLVSITMRAWI